MLFSETSGTEPPVTRTPAAWGRPSWIVLPKTFADEWPVTYTHALSPDPRPETSQSCKTLLPPWMYTAAVPGPDWMIRRPVTVALQLRSVRAGPEAPCGCDDGGG